ncbi:MAG TPA: hypothetical protein VL068_13145 [Microthrixaceae bacterium]|nr:hypothetical protein [Microthrixaceae bacterium]
MPPQLVSLEYVVEDLERVLELLVGLVGLSVIDRRPHPVLDAEVVVLDLGPVVLTLIHPTSDGDRTPVNPVSCNLTQLVLTVDEPLEQLTGRLAEAGVGVIVDSPSMSHLSLQTTNSVFGVAPALVFSEPPEIAE